MRAPTGTDVGRIATAVTATAITASADQTWRRFVRFVRQSGRTLIASIQTLLLLLVSLLQFKRSLNLIAMIGAHGVALHPFTGSNDNSALGIIGRREMMTLLLLLLF